MDSQSINRATILFGDKIPIANFPYLQGVLSKTDITEHDLTMIAIQMKDPTISLILSILVGSLGVDRFYVGNIGLGILKLITCGGLGIWWLVDIFLIMGITRDNNWNLLMNSLQRYQQSHETGVVSYSDKG
ncbi:MAG: TM2 domain-containing protein [Prevotella sp.]|jgi:TM2 domain-containing membrane protein YozV